MFFASQSEAEQLHLVKALRFELGKCANPDVRERMVHHLAQVDAGLAGAVASHLGLQVPAKAPAPPNLSVPADGDPSDFLHRDLADRDAVSPALSMAMTEPGPIASRRIAVLVADDFDAAGVHALSKALAAEKAAAVLVGPRIGAVTGDDGKSYGPPFSILTTSSVLFDAVVVAGGAHAADWQQESDALAFVRDAYGHCKAIAAFGDGRLLLEAAGIPTGAADDDRPADAATIVAPRMTAPVTKRFIAAVASHRLWEREPALHLPEAPRT
jgi:catalase